jgi:dTDP-4-dehydrorhamnose reductase
MRAWILGAGGMLGSCLHKLLLEKGIDVIASTKEQADITSYETLRELCQKIDPTHIFNCAAFTSVDEAELKPELALRINAQAPGLLGKIAKERGCKLVHVSTDYVFSGERHRPFKEEDPTNPINAYGVSKLEGEKALLSVYSTACILRTSWVYGPAGKNFISSIVKLLQTKQSLQIANDQVGKPTYCKDLAEALWESKDASGIYHFSGKASASRFEIAQAVLEYMKENHLPFTCKEIIPVPASTFQTLAPRPSYSVLDTEKFERDMQRKPRDWKDTLQELFHESGS